MARSRTDLFDFAAAGLLAGGAASAALFAAGLAASAGGGGADPAAAGLIPIPSALFQGSLLLGGAAKLGLGAEALARANVYVSPLLVGGWCGLVTTALNALPVGNLDGGRVALVRGWVGGWVGGGGVGVGGGGTSARARPRPPPPQHTHARSCPPPRAQAAYGKSALAFTSLLSYIGLGLGLLGSSLALPFGLYVLICQRTSGGLGGWVGRRGWGGGGAGGLRRERA